MAHCATKPPRAARVGRIVLFSSELAPGRSGNCRIWDDMLLLKYLPTVREPRLYLGMERTYLSYIKFLFVAFGTGVLSEKLTLLFSVIHLDRLVPFFRDLYLLLTWPSLFLLCLVFFRFVSDLRYVDGGVAVTAREIQDPRIYLSAERTMLAWFRSGIAMVAFGFVI